MMGGKRYPAILAALCLAWAASAPAGAEPLEIEGIAFERSIVAGEVPLELHAVGVLEWFFLTGYVAGLYLGPDTKPENVLADRPKRLELHYFYAIDGSDFGPAAWKVMTRNLDAPTLERVRQRADRLAGAYEDVTPGDRYALTYLPGVGTQLTLNGEPKVTIEGADFAAAYFGVWLGKQPIDTPLRDQLLTAKTAEKAEAR